MARGVFSSIWRNQCDQSDQYLRTKSFSALFSPKMDLQSKRNGHRIRSVHMPTCFALLFGWFLYIFCRKTFSSTMPHLTYKLGFTKDQLGTISSSFSLAYGLSKFLGAIVSDHTEQRLLFSAGLFLTGLATILFPLQSTITYCSLIIFLQGTFQGAGWPAVAKILKMKFPAEKVGLYWSLTSCAGSLAGSASPILVAYLIDMTDWYGVYYCVGGISILSSFVVYFSLPRLSSKETDNKSNKPTTDTNYSYKQLFFNVELWIATWIYFFVYIFKNALGDWGQLYFIQQLKYTQTSAAFGVGMILFGGSIGSIVFGYFSDYLLKKLPSNSRQPRSPSLLLSCIVFTIFIHAFIFYQSSEFLTNVFCFFLGFCIDGACSVIGVIAMDTVPDSRAGLAHGIACAWAQVGTLLSGWPFSILVLNYGWKASFTFMEILSFLVITLASWLTYKTFSKTKVKDS